MLEPLDESGWRSFRLFMRSLDESEWEVLEQQVQQEIVYRQECERSALRLFFSSLSTSDLQQALASIRREREELREIVRQLQAESRARKSSPGKKPRHKTSRA